jgi:hypothetical protein
MDFSHDLSKKAGGVTHFLKICGWKIFLKGCSDG